MKAAVDANCFLTMLDKIALALEQNDLDAADRALQSLSETDAQTPRAGLYRAQIFERRQRLEEARAQYLQLLRDTTNSKIISQARQGIARLDALEADRRQSAIATAMSEPGGKEPGVLVLAEIDPELRPTAAKHLANIMQIDPYSARLQLPSRGWRLYRAGAMGELQFYVRELTAGEIPCFCQPLAAIAPIQVLPVRSLQLANETAIAFEYLAGDRKLEEIVVERSQITQQVIGLLPLFESVVDLDKNRKLVRKTQTADYAQFIDLHVPERQMILRLCDRSYDFRGDRLPPDVPEPSTLRQKWNALVAFLAAQLPHAPVWDRFTPFAEAAIDFQELLAGIAPHVEIERQQPSSWDTAFQLYSTLVYLRSLF